MSRVTIVTHFSNPNWPVVNKLRAICRCHDVTIIHCASLDKLIETLREPLSPRNLLFTDEGLLDLAAEKNLFDLNPNLEIALFITSPIPNVAQRIANHKKVTYLIGSQQAEEHGRDLSILINKFSQGDILDLEKYLAFGTKIQKRKVNDPPSKREALEAIEKYVAKLGDPGYNHPFNDYAQRSCELADELLMNAIFDANPRMAGVDRGLPFHLKLDEEVDIAWGYDGEYFGISVRDPFGRMTSDTLMNYIARRSHVDDIMASESAGLGLKFILERAHKVVTNVRQSRVTEVIALARFTGRMLEFETAKKSLYFFKEDA